MTRLFEYRIYRETEKPVPACWKVFTTVFAVGMLLPMLWVCTSCRQETEIDNTDDIMITLKLSLPGDEAKNETRAISANKESYIDDDQLKVLVFKVVGASETFAYEAPQVRSQSGSYVVTLKQSQAGEAYRLVVIANAGSKLPFIPEGTAKKDALRMITFNSTGAWNAGSDTNFSPIPLWGEATAAKVIATTTTFGSITLLRALARIDVGCAISGETASGLGNFTLKTVTVYRISNKGYAAPVDAASINNNVVSSVSIPADAGINAPLTYNCTDGKALIRAIYVAETSAGTSSTNNVCLVIGGTYRGSTNYYRIDLESAGSYVSLKRNCRYVINIKAVSNAGYTTEDLALTGDKTVGIATSISANNWAGETANGSGAITLP